MARNVMEIKNPGSSNHFEQLVSKLSWSNQKPKEHCYPFWRIINEISPPHPNLNRLSGCFSGYLCRSSWFKYAFCSLPFSVAQHYDRNFLKLYILTSETFQPRELSQIPYQPSHGCACLNLDLTLRCESELWQGGWHDTCREPKFWRE